MLDSIRAALGHNAGIKFTLLMLVAAMIPCYCVGGALLVINNNNRQAASPTPPPTTQVSIQPSSTPDRARPATITPIGLQPTATSALLATPVQIFTPGGFATYDTSLLTVVPFATIPEQAVLSTPGSITGDSPLSACPDADGTVTAVIRTFVPENAAGSATIYCKALTNPYSIGIQAVLDRGVKVAVDIFAFLPGGTPVTRFERAIRVCLQGNGVFLFLNASGSPRFAQQLVYSYEDAYTCANVPDPGTVVLTDR